MDRFRMNSLFKQLPKPPEKPTPPNVKNPMKRQRSKKQLKVEPKPKPVPKSAAKPKQKKKRIPAALREQVWLHRMGKVFEGKCPTTWCQNTITVFDFQSGHNIPESKGGPTTLENLIPLCSRCNLSMGNDYTFEEWCTISNQPEKTVEVVEPPRRWCSFFCIK